MTTRRFAVASSTSECCEVVQGGDGLGDGVLDPEAQVGDHLVVAGAGRVQPARGFGADYLR